MAGLGRAVEREEKLGREGDFLMAVGPSEGKEAEDPSLKGPRKGSVWLSGPSC